MDLYEKEPAVTRALALALMRQALEFLAAVSEDEASNHLQLAVEALLKPKRAASAKGTGQ